MAEQDRTPITVSPLRLIRLTFEKWYADNMPRHAAALAYYTMFAVAPVLVIVVAIAGLIYGREAAQGKIAAQVDHYINSPPAAALIQDMLISLNRSSSNVIITAVSIVALIYGASSVFSELQITLNQIWHAPRKMDNGVWSIVWQRLLTVGMVFVSGLVLFLSLVLSTWITAANQWASLRFAHLPEYSEWSYFLLLLGVTTIVFVLIYRFVPDVRKPWHDVIIGAIATALLFSIARLLLGWYLSYTSIASTYGAAGSLALMLLWVYYSAQIFFLGAEFTQVYGQLYRLPAQSKPAPVVPLPVPSTPYPTPADETTSTAAATPELLVAAAEPVEPDSATVTPAAGPEPVAELPANRSRLERIRATLWRPLRRNRVQTDRPAHWARLHATGQLLKNVARLPLRMTRPLGEIALAATVISVASLAALLLGPWRRRPAEEE